MNPCEHMDGLNMDLAHAAEEINRLKQQRDELVAALEKIGEIASPYRDGVKFNYIADITQAALAKVGADKGEV